MLDFFNGTVGDSCLICHRSRGLRLKLVTSILAFTLSTTLSSPLFAFDKNAGIRNAKQIVNDARDGIAYREMLYDEAFQQRFSLPRAGIEKLDNGLMAIAFEASASQSGSRQLICKMHLYVDANAVSLSLPNSQRGTNPRSTGNNHRFFTDRHSIDKDDQAFMMKLMQDYSNRLLIRSDNYPKGVTHTLALSEYEVDVYPGIALFSFEPSCDALSYSNLGEANIWLNKNTNTESFPQPKQKTNSLNSYKFKLPTRLTRSFSRTVNHVNAENQKNRREFSIFFRKYREILNREKGFSIPRS